MCGPNLHEGMSSGFPFWDIVLRKLKGILKGGNDKGGVVMIWMGVCVFF